MLANITVEIKDVEISSPEGKTTHARALAHFMGQPVLLDIYGQSKAQKLYEGNNKTFNICAEGLNGSPTSQKILHLDVLSLEEVEATQAPAKETSEDSLAKTLEPIKEIYQVLLDKPKNITKKQITEKLGEICQ